MNLFSSLSRSAVGLLLGLFATPIILRYLGEEKFGAFLVLFDWVAHLGILEFGLFTALLPIFAHSLSPVAKISPKIVIHEAAKKYLQVIVLQIFGVFLLYLFLDRLIPVREELQNDLNLALIFLGATVFFNFSQIFRAYLDASQRGYLISITMVIQNVLTVSASLTAAYMGMGIKGQAAAHSLSLGVSFLILFYLSKGLLDNEEKSEKGKKEEFDQVLKKQRMPHFLAHLCGQLSFLVDKLFISAFLGAKSVTAFYLTQRLAQISMQQLQHLGNSTWPAMSEIYHQQKHEDLVAKILSVTEFIACASGCLLTVVVLVNSSFVHLWTGETTFVGVGFSNLVIFNTGLIAINSFWLWCFTGVGFISLALPMLVCQALVNLAISALGTYFYGLYGPPLGTLVSFSLITQPWTSILLHRKFQVPIAALSRSWLLPLVLPLGATIFFTYWLGVPRLESWLELVLGCVALSLGTLIIFPFLFVRPSTRREIHQRLRKAFQDKLGF